MHAVLHSNKTLSQYQFAAKRQYHYIWYYLLERIVCAKCVFKAAVLKVIAIEENMIPADVGVTGTVGRQ